MVGRFALVLSVALLTWNAFGQETGFVTVENPFQDERPIKLGEPITLRIEVAQTQFLELTLTSQEEVEPGKIAKCQLTLTGQRQGSSKAEILPILLLEDEKGETLERLRPSPFKVKGNKPFEYRETLKVTGDALKAVARVWIYLEVR
ncbi:MAG: hypothetical protein ACUVRY_09995 [Thermoanaerobaculaceae bacterium]